MSNVTVSETVQKIEVNETTQVITISLGTAATIGGGTNNHTELLNIGTNTHAQIDSHIASTSNPHSVSKTDVGLANVDNTSDANKPISTATQSALDNKLDATLQPLYCFLKDIKASGTDGGTLTAGDDGGVFGYQRELNDLSGTTSFVSLLANRFTLDAGTYIVEGQAPAFQVNGHQAVLYNYSDSTIEVYGSTAICLSSDATGASSTIMGQFTIASSKEFEIRHKSTATKASNGRGAKATFDNEIYTQVKIIKVA